METIEKTGRKFLMHEQVDKSPTDTLADLIAKANADLMMKQETFILHFFDGLENFKRYHQNYHFIFAPVEWI